MGNHINTNPKADGPAMWGRLEQYDNLTETMGKLYEISQNRQANEGGGVKNTKTLQNCRKTYNTLYKSIGNHAQANPKADGSTRGTINTIRKPYKLIWKL